ncbi:hypothetical protein BKA70DRAFT_1265528, partial [Coprinopsis sp. MPI-PUGE-AT-0042]
MFLFCISFIPLLRLHFVTRMLLAPCLSCNTYLLTHPCPFTSHSLAATLLSPTTLYLHLGHIQRPTFEAPAF